LKIKQNQETKNVLINKNAIPQGFANVMKDICYSIGIKAEIVEGWYKLFSDNYTKFQMYNFTKHYWISLIIDDKPYMLDVMYGNNVLNKSKFDKMSNDFCFLCEYDKFIYEYYPLEWK